MDVFTVEAVYENGVLKPAKPLELTEGQHVRVTVRVGPSRAQQTLGLIPWSGDAATLEYFALSPDLDPAERP
jgi:predicted DNA-binding antitoxin AbrB/MazE fold protein